MRKATKILVILFVTAMLTIVTANASAAPGLREADIQPRYIGANDADAALSISPSGRADVRGIVEVLPGYTASVTVTLYKDSGSYVQSWSRSGGGAIEVAESRYVTSGHDYYVTLSATIYNSSGRGVDTIRINSTEVYY